MKNRKIKTFLLLLLALLLLCTSCATIPATTVQDDNPNSLANLKWSINLAYQRAQEKGYEGTLEEFLALIQGTDGKDGVDGKDGIDGKDGADGKDGIGIAKAELNHDHELIITYTDGTIANLGKVATDGKDGVDGKNGANGIGIATAEINAQDELVLTYTNGSTVNLGFVKGANGKDGIGIAKAELNHDHELIITYTDGTIANLGKITPDEHSHTWNDGEIFEEPSFYSNGFKIYVCTECNEIKWEYLPSYPKDSILYSYVKETDSFVVSEVGPDVENALIEATHEGKAVTGISNGAFSDRPNLKSVFLPEGITTIPTCAFAQLSALESVSLPQTLRTIEPVAFQHCSSLRSIVIPEGVTIIGLGAFAGCSSLQTVAIPEGVVAIGANAFSDCTGLKTVSLPKSLATIGCFLTNCNQLSEVRYAGTVEEWKAIRPNGFYDSLPEGLNVLCSDGQDDAFLSPLNLDNREIRILQQDTIPIGDSDATNIIDHYLYTRNCSIEEKNNCCLTYSTVAGGFANMSEQLAHVRSSIMAGEPYDLISLYPYALAQLTTEGSLTDLASDAKRPFSEMPWYPADLWNSYSYLDRIYFVSSNCSVPAWNSASVIVSNDQMREAYQIDLIDTFTDNKWTLEEITKISNSVFLDRDGDGTISSGDVFGLVATQASVLPFCYGTGLRVLEKDSAGELQYAIQNDQFNADRVEKIEKLLNKNDGVYFADTGVARNIFTEHRALMIATTMNTVPYYTSDMHISVFPMPKYSSAQETYETIQNLSLLDVWAVPSGTWNSSAMFSLLNRQFEYDYSRTTDLMTEYCLKERANEQNVEMFNLIRASIILDFGYIFDSYLSAPTQIWRTPITNGSGSIATIYASNSNALNAKLAELIYALRDIQ